jgi:uncharacterized protein (TIGR02996 family)
VPTEAELLAAIADNPGDEQTRLVYADWLIARGDRRGELIVLEHRERTTPGGLTHPDQCASLLRLAAEFGFPHLPDPDAHVLPFEQLGRDVVDFRADFEGHNYMLALRGVLFLKIDHGPPIENLTMTLQRRWTDEETNVILSMTSRAIRAGTPFDQIVFPDPVTIASHPDHRLGPLPMYFSAEILEDFDASWLLRARDHARWYAIYDRMMAGFSPTSHRR